MNYVDAHDNETLFDLTMLKMDPDATTAERARVNTVSQATVALSQAVAFWHAGTDVLRSKSLDRNSYNSGDWFNRVDWSYQDNTFGSGLPPEPDNGSKWDYMRPLLERADELRPTPTEITATHERAEDLLRLRYSSPLFRLGDAQAIQQRVTFPDGGPDQPRGVIVMTISDQQGTDLDPQWEEIVVIFNATPDTSSVAVADAGGLQLHPVQAGGSEDLVKATAVGTDTVEVPARTVAVLVRP
ncbi:hypothetical protein BH24ACT15_BH24ACT15_37670 [soil metagenome]